MFQQGTYNIFKLIFLSYGKMQGKCLHELITCWHKLLNNFWFRSRDHWLFFFSLLIYLHFSYNHILVFLSWQMIDDHSWVLLGHMYCPLSITVCVFLHLIINSFVFFPFYSLFFFFCLQFVTLLLAFKSDHYPSYICIMGPTGHLHGMKIYTQYSIQAT